MSLELDEIIEREIRSGGDARAMVVLDAPPGFGLVAHIRLSPHAAGEGPRNGVRWVRAPEQVTDSGVFFAEGQGPLDPWYQHIRSLAGLPVASGRRLRLIILREHSFDATPSDVRNGTIGPVPARDLVLLEREQFLESQRLGSLERARVEMALWGSACLSGGRPAAFRRLFDIAFAVSDARELTTELVQAHRGLPEIIAPTAGDSPWKVLAAWDAAARRASTPKGSIPRMLDGPLRARLIDELLSLELAAVQVLRHRAGWNGSDPTSACHGYGPGAQRTLGDAARDRLKIQRLASTYAGLKYTPSFEAVLGLGQWLSLNGVRIGSSQFTIPPELGPAIEDIQRLRNYVVHGHPLSVPLLARVFDVSDRWRAAVVKQS